MASVTWDSMSHNRVDKQVKYFTLFVGVRCILVYLLSQNVAWLIFFSFFFHGDLFLLFPFLFPSSASMRCDGVVTLAAPSGRKSQAMWDRVLASLYKASLDSPSRARLLMSH